MRLHVHVLLCLCARDTSDPMRSAEAMAEKNMAGGPFTDTMKNGVLVRGVTEAEKRGKKATSLKRLLLNKCQEAFETDDIYAEVRSVSLSLSCFRG